MPDVHREWLRLRPGVRLALQAPHLAAQAQERQFLQDLTLLSLKGVVKRVDGQTFVRVAGRA